MKKLGSSQTSPRKSHHCRPTDAVSVHSNAPLVDVIEAVLFMRVHAKFIPAHKYCSVESAQGGARLGIQELIRRASFQIA